MLRDHAATCAAPADRVASASSPLLVLEASGTTGSIALLGAADGERVRPLLGETTLTMGASRTDGLTPSVTALLATHRVPVDSLGGVVCGAGPGSFTSLRIAAALAKGLAFASGLPLYAVPSLALATPARLDGTLEPGAWLVTADALRGERFAQPVDVHADGALHVPTPARRGVPDGWPTAWADRREVALATGGAASPRAAHVRWLAHLSAWGPVSLDDWEPSYGRLAEAQVQWEARHGTPLPAR
ncbi:MAG TPA: tRNA (adenosine(37)-N6)-threonylcarbamoyltransferase complex dimerization subunit type 1 TsaB [Gemmatimonadaceae bacterium]|nr:tRNA (adenosine(37)-N6)-threonylcarbamoyltransferase complex dimerization subunit type 1 TsaB [Gemmatimonadaceae bacterium]